MAASEAFDSRSDAGSRLPMRVVLLEGEGTMYSLWLPAEREGKYTFGEEHADAEPVPVVITASGGEWYASVGAGGLFFNGMKSIGNRVRLFDHFLGRVAYGKRVFILYADAETGASRVFLPYYLVEKERPITVGGLPDCDIYYPNPLVTGHHASLYWKNNRWYIRDEHSKNGIYLNGKRTYDAALSTGDVIYLMGLNLIMGVGFIAMNNADGRVRLTSPKLHPIQNLQDVVFSPCREDTSLTVFNRPPRRRSILNPKQIAIESPPFSISGNQIPLLLRLGNPMISGGRALASGNILSAVSSLVLPGLTQALTEKDRREYDVKRKEIYEAYLAEKEKEIDGEIDSELQILKESYPDLDTVLQSSADRKRLWERQKRDADFLHVRIGCGTIPMLAEKSYASRGLEVEKDPLLDEMYALAERPAVLHDAPIMLDLREYYICGILGKRSLAIRQLRNMIVQLALTHSYDELKIILLADAETARALSFVRYLPHNWSDDRSIRFYSENRDDAQQLSKYLNGIGEKIKENRDGQKYAKKNPVYVVFSADKELFDCFEMLKEQIENGKYLGFSFVTVYDDAPKESLALMTMGDPNLLIDLAHPENEDRAYSMDPMDPILADRGLRVAARTKLPLAAQSFSLPNTLTFLEMYNAGKVEHLNPLKRWAENDPVKSLAAPIGIGTDGKLFTLDLHEKKQGPHGLIAGMTGSGKSEFIITYILSMAVSYSPDEVAFILIDYKGGGLADAFVDPARGIYLPHVVGTITNLDGAAIQRSLASIKSELKRRQEIFKKAKSDTNFGTMDIYDYQKLYRQKRVEKPLPHLFIISDEFAELKKQQPEFMDELISTARIGRSLGVHLILATQKPAGVVNDQIWSNTKFRVCLKVQDKSDSMEMLKRTEAAEIKNTGRFYLQVGYNELFALGQSAWCGAGYVPQDEVIEEKDDSVRFVDNAGQTVLEVRPNRRVRKSECKQIVAIVQYLSALAKREHVMPKKLWCDPLPTVLDYEALRQDEKDPEQGIRTVLGTTDDPERQRQFPFALSLKSFHNLLIVGSSGSGKSTFVSTLLFSLMERCGPDELSCYITDLSGGVLSGFRNMPHCGAYLTENDEADFDRLIAMLREIIQDRKALFREAEVSGFEAYRQIRTIPELLFIIDSFQNITGYKKGGTFFSEVHTLMSDASSCGIHFVLTVNHMNEISSKSKQELDGRIALHAKDKYEYGEILNTRCQIAPPNLPGRGVCMAEGRPLEFQAARLFSQETEHLANQHLKERLSLLAAQYAGVPGAKRLPILDGIQTYEEFAAELKPGRIPLGYSAKDMKPVLLPFRQLLCLPIYFGNPFGVRPVLHNLLHAAEKNGMRLLIVKRNEDSVFSAQNSLLSDFRLDAKLMNCSSDEVAELALELNNEVLQRNEVINAFSDENGIPRTERGRAKKAAAYLQQHTTPVLVLFESFREFAKLKKDQTTESIFQSFLSALKGYNIYFIGCFYPEDASALRADMLLPSFLKDELFLLFGGRYDKQCLTTALPQKYRGIVKPLERYDRCVLHYSEEWYDMQMPCGEIRLPELDPDEAPIL